MAKSEELVRVELARVQTYAGSCREVVQRMNVYVDQGHDLKIGHTITLIDSDDPCAEWRVIRVHETVKRSSIKLKWDNNI